MVRFPHREKIPGAMKALCERYAGRHLGRYRSQKRSRDFFLLFQAAEAFLIRSDDRKDSALHPIDMGLQRLVWGKHRGSACMFRNAANEPLQLYVEVLIESVHPIIR